MNFNKVLLLGDFNARTAEDKDYVILEGNCDFGLDIEEFVDVNHNHYFEFSEFKLNRKSKDKSKNRFGNQLLEFCKMNNFYILNGRSKSDHNGDLTCRNASVVDYCICSSNLLPILLDFEIKEFSSLLSDVHSPLMVTMKSALQSEPSVAHSSREDNKCVKINKWDGILENEFVKNIESKEIDDILSEVNGIDPNNVTKTEIDNIVDKLGNIYINSAKKTFGTKEFSSKIRRKNIESVKKNVYKPWFNEGCKNK